MLLSLIRKILAICILNKIFTKICTHIPKNQSAYQPGRSTTEQVFTCKILAEQAITSSNHEIFILLLDMSKAFDTVNRHSLINDLENILSADEIHLISILLQDLKIQVRCQDKYSNSFSTNVGVPQGDCLSPILFILYLANALKTVQIPNIPQHITEHAYSTPPTTTDFLIEPKYADDITYISNNPNYISEIQQIIPQKLLEKNLLINEDKTEIYSIKRKSNEKWRKCRYLGSLLDTELDIKRRKTLAILACNQFQNSFNSKHIHLLTKMRIFNTFIGSIFLYNSELWTLTKMLNNQIDSFHRRLLRRAINIKWPNKISNTNLNNITNQIPWSKNIKQRRLNWVGHLVRLDDDTPAIQALIQATKSYKKPQGGQKLTWLKQIKNYLKNTTLDIVDRLTWCVAYERDEWREQVKRAMSNDV